MSDQIEYESVAERNKREMLLNQKIREQREKIVQQFYQSSLDKILAQPSNPGQVVGFQAAVRVYKVNEGVSGE